MTKGRQGSYKYLAWKIKMRRLGGAAGGNLTLVVNMVGDDINGQCDDDREKKQMGRSNPRYTLPFKWLEF